MKYLRHILVLAMMLPALFGMAAATQSAASILSQVRNNIASAPSVEAVFSINGGSGPVQGSLIMAGAKFSMTTPQLSVWYDGKTQWTLMTESREVSITEPDADEMMASNPFAILSSPQSHYSIRRLSDSNGRYRIELKPVDKTSVIERYVLFVNQSTHWPAAVVVEFSDGRKMELVLDAIGAGKAKTASAFVYDAKKHPAIEIIDLR